MTWFDSGRTTTPMGDRLQHLWEREEILQTPGAHNALAGLLAKRAGFEALYLSGGAVSASLGLPDLGVMTIEEVLVFVRSITRATDLPLIVDGDTGYGEALNVMRLVRDLEDAGAAAVDLLAGKTLGGHFDVRGQHHQVCRGDGFSAQRVARAERTLGFHLQLVAQALGGLLQGFCGHIRYGPRRSGRW